MIPGRHFRAGGQPASRQRQAHANQCLADLFKSGLVWASLGLRWVEQVRDEMAAFPHSENDDLHGAAVYGLLRIRQGGLMRLSTDLESEYQPRRPMEYY